MIGQKVPGTTFAVTCIPTGQQLIVDSRYPDDDARHLVACLDESEGYGVDVVWLRPTDLPARFDSCDAILEALRAR